MNPSPFLFAHPETSVQVTGIPPRSKQTREDKLAILRTEASAQAYEAAAAGRHDDADEWLEIRNRIGGLL